MLVFSFLVFPMSLMGKTKVVSLHPIITDIAKKIGGEQIEVVDLLGSSANVHSFSPTPSALKKATGAELYLAAGKGLESYLPKLEEMVGKSKVIEVGNSVTSIVIKDESFT